MKWVLDTLGLRTKSLLNVSRVSRPAKSVLNKFKVDKTALNNAKFSYDFLRLLNYLASGGGGAA